MQSPWQDFPFSLNLISLKCKCKCLTLVPIVQCTDWSLCYNNYRNCNHYNNYNYNYCYYNCSFRWLLLVLKAFFVSHNSLFTIV